MTVSLNHIYLANENAALEAEVRTLQRRLSRRDHEINKQERELHKLRVRVEMLKPEIREMQVYEGL